ncbi:hypothetical protein ScPMuIL_005231, partial [Solemya velum]
PPSTHKQEMSGPRKKKLAEFEHLNPVVLEKIQESWVRSETVSSELQELQQSTTTKDQVTSLKKACDQVKSSFHNGKDDDRVGLEVLILIYLTCSPKHTAKRIIASSFQNFPVSSRDVLINHMAEAVLTRLSNLKETLDQTIFSRQGVDIISGLMENFSVGELCLKLIAVTVFAYLANTLDYFLDQFKSDLSPVQKNEIMHHCLATIQATNRLLQKCIPPDILTVEVDNSDSHGIDQSVDLFIKTSQKF